MTAVLAQVQEVVRATDDNLDLGPALAACVQLSLAGPHLGPGQGRCLEHDHEFVVDHAEGVSLALGIGDALAEFRPAVVSFHFGLPSVTLLARVRSWGARILSSATTVDEALWLEARGVDAIIAQGLEAGGHRDLFLSDDVNTQVGTFALLPQIAKAVRWPVVAAGGIADAKVAAAMTLGAAGVQIGTAYLLCPEANTSAVHRAALKSEAARRTALTNLFSGRPARGIMNRIMRELGPISAATPAFPLATAGIMPLRARAESQGSGDFSPLWSGQNAGGCKEIPAADLTRELAAGL